MYCVHIDRSVLLSVPVIKPSGKFLLGLKTGAIEAAKFLSCTVAFSKFRLYNLGLCFIIPFML